MYKSPAVPSRLSSGLVTLLVLGLATLVARPVRADGQASLRNTLELGQRRRDGGDEFIIGTGLRADLMFGAPRPRAFRIGPALELRTMEFKTAEAALGAGILIPLPGDLPIGLTGLLGTALRKGDRPDGLVGIGTVTWGYRGYNYHGWYGYGLNLFFSGRKHLGDEQLVELTGGVEIDFLFTTIVPSTAIWSFLKRRDPHEAR